FEHRHDEHEKCTGGEDVLFDLVATDEEEKRDSYGANHIPQRGAKGLGAPKTQVGGEQSPRNSAEAATFPALPVKSLYDVIANDSLVQQVLNFGELVLSQPCGVTHLRTNLARRRNHYRNEQDENPGQLSAAYYDDTGQKEKREQLLQELSQDSRHRVLHTLNIVDDRR